MAFENSAAATPQTLTAAGEDNTGGPGRGGVLCGAPVVARLNPPRWRPMSWSELQRLVEQAESDAALRRALTHCRSRSELVLASQRLGFAIDGRDLKLAWELHQLPCPGRSSPAMATAGHRAR